MERLALSVTSVTNMPGLYLLLSGQEYMESGKDNKGKVEEESPKDSSPV